MRLLRLKSVQRLPRRQKQKIGEPGLARVQAGQARAKTPQAKSLPKMARNPKKLRPCSQPNTAPSLQRIAANPPKTALSHPKTVPSPQKTAASKANPPSLPNQSESIHPNLHRYDFQNFEISSLIH